VFSSLRSRPCQAHYLSIARRKKLSNRDPYGSTTEAIIYACVKTRQVLNDVANSLALQMYAKIETAVF